MKAQISRFVNLRVYKNLKTVDILNSMMCNRLMRIPPLVKHSRSLYQMSSKMFSRKFVDYILSNTFCKILTAGNTLEQANRLSDYFRKQKIPVILDYCAQGQIAHQQGESLLDSNAALFAQSAQALKNQMNQMISIKITGLIKMQTLKELNDSVQMRNKFWSQNQVNGKLRSGQFFNGIRKIYAGLTQIQFEQYVRKIYNYKGQITAFQIDQVDFKMKHHPFYLYQHQKNDDFVIKLFSPFSKSKIQQFYTMTHRINRIVQPQANNKNNLRILVDAQQSYVQLAIQFIAQQMQQRYNKQRIYIIPTVQNYLKRSVQRTKYQIQIAKRKNLKFSAKLVRGAYLVQETRIAKQNNVDNPVVQCFQKTTENYLNSFEQIVKSVTEGQVIVATHNQQTIHQTQQIYKRNQGKIKMSYAQLLGLADHLTWKVKSQNFTVYKYLPWAKTHTMIPYMIRRAQQLNQMRYPLDTQYQLLKHQLKYRFVN